MNKCIDCGIVINYRSKRCKNCWIKFKHLNRKNYRYYCVDCNKELSRRESKRCHSCENKRRHKIGISNFKGENNPNFRNGNSYYQHYCLICGNPISRSNFFNGNQHCYFCANQINGFNLMKSKVKCIDCGKELSNRYNIRCHSCHTKNLWKRNIFKPKKGKNHSNWMGGITKLGQKIRNLKQYTEWVKKVFKRDNYTCQICGQKGKELNVHHKIPLGAILVLYSIKNIPQSLKCNLLWDINNGITLCRKHHEMIEPKLKNSKNRRG